MANGINASVQDNSSATLISYYFFGYIYFISVKGINYCK